MKKNLLVLFFVLFAISVQAQSQNQSFQNLQEEQLFLVQKVDSLEHELSYLKLTYELFALDSEIETFSNEVSTKSNAIELKLYNRDFDYKLGKAYQQYYEQCLDNKQSFENFIELKKKYLALKVITYPYSESELDLLMSYCDKIDTAYATLETALNMLKILVEAYQKAK